MQNYEQATNDVLPLACTLTAEEQGTRGEEFRDIFQAALQVRELADGYAFAYPGEQARAEQLLHLLMKERECCPFFIFELLFEPALGPVWLHIRGQEGVKEMIQDQFLPLLQK